MPKNVICICAVLVMPSQFSLLTVSARWARPSMALFFRNGKSGTSCGLSSMSPAVMNFMPFSRTTPLLPSSNSGTRWMTSLP